MSLSFKFIPLTFLSDENEIKKQIRNTIILKYFFERNSETVHLEDLITGTQYGYNASALVQGRNKFLRISDITDGKVNWETVPYCNCTDEDTYLLFPNDILIARTGGTTGKSFLISKPPALSIYAGYLIRIRANDSTNPNYLNLFLNSYVYWSQIVSLNEDNFRPSVNAEKLKKLVLPKCDSNTQRDVVQISNGELISGYDDLYKLIEETLLKYDKLKVIQVEKRNQLELQKILKQSILSDAIKGNLTKRWREENPNIENASKLLERIKEENTQLIKDKKLKKTKPLSPISKEEIPFDLPVNWTWCRLGEISSYLNGNGFDSNDFIKSIGIKCIKITNAGVGEIIETDDRLPIGFDEKYHSYLVNTNDIVIALTRPYIAEGLKVSLCPEAYNNSLLNQRVAVVRGYKRVMNVYIYIFLRSDFVLKRFQKEFESKGQQPNLKTDHITNLLFPLAPTEEQNIIIEKIESLMKICKSLENEILVSEKQANQLMQIILKEAFEVKEKEVILN